MRITQEQVDKVKTRVCEVSKKLHGVKCYLYRNERGPRSDGNLFETAASFCKILDDGLEKERKNNIKISRLFNGTASGGLMRGFNVENSGFAGFEANNNSCFTNSTKNLDDNSRELANEPDSAGCFRSKFFCF